VAEPVADAGPLADAHCSTFPRRDQDASGRVVAEHFLERLVDRLPAVGDEASTAYLGMLDRALVDRVLSATETAELIAMADLLGIGRRHVMRLHRDYLEALAVAAWEDGLVTAAERADLMLAARLLGLDESDVDVALQQARPAEGNAAPTPRAGPTIERFVLRPGDQVVFTGEMQRDRPVWEVAASDAGLQPHRTVTRHTALLVAADPDTLSRKAARARDYEIPIVTESAFQSMLRALSASQDSERTTADVACPERTVSSVGHGEAEVSPPKNEVEVALPPEAVQPNRDADVSFSAEPIPSHAPVSTSGSPFEIELSVVPTINYALAHNGIPVVNRLVVRNVGPSAIDYAAVSVRLIDSEGELSEPWTRSVALAPGTETVLDGVEVRADPAALLQVAEQRPGAILAAVSAPGVEAASARCDVRVLAANQWLSASQVLDYEMLCSFVMPNHPAVTELLADVSSRLEASTGRSALDGYQSGPERADDIVAAVFESMRSRGNRYAEPPASWSDVGQKVRTPEEVLDGRFGTCLDTVVVMAAVLEQCGIRPLLWIVEGHAFLGYWREENSLAQTVDLDVARIVNLVDIGLIGVVETTLITDRAHGDTFADAQLSPRRTWLAADLARVLAVIDVYRGRRNGIIPLPARVRDAEGVTQVVQYVPAVHGAPSIVVAGTRRSPDGEIQREVPARVQSWKNSLLDLSLRNRLINLPAQRASASLVVPDGQLGAVEDLLNAGVPLRLLPANAFDDVHGARGTASARDLPQELLSGALAERSEIYTNLTVDTYQSRLRSLAHRARTIEEDTGANNLYLALGSLVWRLDTRELRSPLILIPVTLNAVARQGIYRVALDESGGSTPNFCLLEKLRQVHGLSIPALQEPETDESGIDLDRTFDQVRAALATAGISARVEASADLAILQFAKFRLWKDLDEHWATFAENPLVSHLISTPTEPFVDPAPQSDPPDLEKLAADLPVSADASQITAVAQATEGKTFVLEGPPGTGKSQTITNLLAHAVASGRKVLFVAEKRAALDVVRRRLDAIGMGVFALDLHDKASKPATVLAQIRAALDSRTTVDEHGLHADREELFSAARSLSRYASRLHEPNNAGFSLYGAHDRALAYGDGPALTVPSGVLSRSTDEIASLRDLLARLPEQADEVRPRHGHPWGFIDTSEASEQRIEAIRQASLRADRAVEALGATGALQTILHEVSTPEDLSTLAEFLRHGPVSLDTLDETRSVRWREAASRASQDVAMFVAAAHPGLDQVAPEALALPVADIHSRALAAAASGFFGRKKRLRLVAAELAPVLRAGASIEPKHLVALTTALLQVQGATRELAVRASSIPGMTVPPSWNPLTAQGEQIVANQLSWLSWAGQHVDDAEGGSASFITALRGFLRQAPLATPSDVDAVEEAAAAFGDLLAATGITQTSFEEWASDSGLLTHWTSTSAGRASADPNGLSLRRWLEFLQALDPLRAAGMHDARKALRNGDVNADDATRAFERGVTQASVAERFEHTGLGAFDAATQGKSIARFTRSAASVRAHLRNEIPRRVVATRSFSPESGLGQVGALQRELAKQRRGLGVRNLLSTYGELIVASMPCVLVSPESVARFFPATAGLFDLVVFDEASQIRVADAIGAMGRARSVVVVGDSKQMPPTSFAEPSAGADDDDDAADADLLAVEDEESILSECVQARVPRQWLSWHYRSQDESLIAFSNQHYYENRLSSFPSPATGPSDPGVRGTGVSLVRVNGQFQRSGKGKLVRTNQVEAEAVVEDIRRRFRAQPDTTPSLGVVTFNMQQRSLIESMLRDLGDDRIIAALDDRGDSGLFVKNLENVQGDERDVILFSVAFSRNERDYLPLNFGPLNRGGGERRLNVAVTRARRQIVLYCSFEPGELRAEETSSVGIKHLRSYLEFAAASSDRTRTVSDGKEKTRDRHREEVAAALAERGVVVSTDVGLSDFRIDLSLAQADEAQRPLIAVLLDGPGWAARKTVGDRDGLPVEVLSKLLRWPAVERVWLPEWLADSDGVADRLAAACRAAAVIPGSIAPGTTPSTDDGRTLVTTSTDAVLDE
jgi:hypothetical protein